MKRQPANRSDSDLAQRKPTLPLIRALQRADAQHREYLLSILRGETNGQTDALLSCFEQYDVLAYTQAKGREFAQRALDQLALLPRTPARQSLRRLGEFVVNRSH